MVVATILLISEIHSAADVTRVLLLGGSLAVAAVPAGLPAILSVVLALGLRRMARGRTLARREQLRRRYDASWLQKIAALRA